MKFKSIVLVNGSLSLHFSTCCTTGSPLADSGPASPAESPGAIQKIIVEDVIVN